MKPKEELYKEIGEMIEKLSEYSLVTIRGFIEDENQPTMWEVEFFSIAYDDDVIESDTDLHTALSNALRYKENESNA